MRHRSGGPVGALSHEPARVCVCVLSPSSLSIEERTALCCSNRVPFSFCHVVFRMLVFLYGSEVE